MWRERLDELGVPTVASYPATPGASLLLDLAQPLPMVEMTGTYLRATGDGV